MRFLAAISIYLCLSLQAIASFDPNNPEASGYAITFDDEFDSISTVDMSNTQAPGFKWYLTAFFGNSLFSSANVSMTGGVLTISSGNRPGYCLWSAVPTPSHVSPYYNGTVFSGGFYVEASIAFDNTLVTNPSVDGFPVLWLESIQHALSYPGNSPLAANADRWPGQASGYEHWVEDDFFAYDFNAGGANPTKYSSPVLDWWGIFNSTCTPSYCLTQNGNIITLGATTWTSFHRVGRLYTPGTPGNNWQGSITAYFDGVQVGATITWTGNQGNGTPAPTGTFLYSAVDAEALVLILATGTGQPLQIDYVRVWQLPGNPPVAKSWFH
jgi:hypothetical protein